MIDFLRRFRPGWLPRLGRSQQPPFHTLVDMLEHQARRTPRAVAVTFDGRDYCYADLDRAAEAVARAVAARVEGPEPLVGLCIDRSFEMIACLIGILKAGAAYLPLDPSLPDARLRQIAAEAGPSLILAQTGLAGRLAHFDTPILAVEDVDRTTALAAHRGTAASQALVEGSLAYVLYTSGSTGRPKGVEITHGSLVNLLASCRHRPGMGRHDVVLALARFSFDVFVAEVFLPLSCGARVVLLGEGAARDPELLAQEIERHGATVVQAPPALWQSLVETGWRGSLRLRAWTGAEALSRPLADRLLPLCGEVWNCYGPTETTVLATVHRVEAGNGDIPIGGPIAATTVSVRGNGLQPLPAGQQGELCIGGAGLARGYRGQAALTAERFVVPPGEKDRVYRTGDLARLDADGHLLFIGRTDAQVKVRGFRVEPGEIEHVLAAHEAVAACAVRVWPDAIGHNALIAYVVRRAGASAAQAELRAFVRSRLPDYMVSQRIVFLAQLPLTPNAKVDRAALPDPSSAPAADGRSRTAA